MRFVLTMILMGTVLAGCSSASIVQNSPGAATPGNPSPENRPIMSVATEGRFTEEAPTEDTSAGSPQAVMTVNSPPILLTPVQGNATPLAPTMAPAATGNWSTFSSAALGVTVNYPPDWTVTEQSDVATFTSTQGAVISLQADNAANANNELRIGNQYCTSRMNSYHQTANICADNASFTYSAKFMVPLADGSTHGVSLITRNRSAGNIFEAMIDTLRPTQ